MIRVAAPAKINLFLHVGERRPDGFHELQSLIGFTEAGVLHEVAYKFDKWLDLAILEKTISG